MTITKDNAGNFLVRGTQDNIASFVEAITLNDEDAIEGIMTTLEVK